MKRSARSSNRNFAERREIGAAFAATVDGEVVVDLYGGSADRVTGRPWRADTLQVIFSGTKGLVAICVLLLLERGVLELDRSVSYRGPEFGKQAVRVPFVSMNLRPGQMAPSSF